MAGDHNQSPAVLPALSPGVVQRRPEMGRASISGHSNCNYLTGLVPPGTGTFIGVLVGGGGGTLVATRVGIFVGTSVGPMPGIVAAMVAPGVAATPVVLNSGEMGLPSDPSTGASGPGNS